MRRAFEALSMCRPALWRARRQSRLTIHRRAQAPGTQVGPVLVNPRQALGAGTSWPSSYPPRGDLIKVRPQRVLLLVIDEHQKIAVFVIERIGHNNDHLCPMPRPIGRQMLQMYG